MKASLESLANFIGFVVWADGEYDEAEKEAVDDVEIGQVYESAMQVAIADGVLTRGEVNNLLAIADALGIDTDMACLLLCDMVKTEAELEIDTEEDEE